MTVQTSPTIAHDRMANAIRALSMDAVEAANSGHPGMPMGMADVATVLYSKFLKFDAAQPGWADRDRFVLSAGHGSMLLYSLLYLTGYPEMTIEQIRNFRQLGSMTAGHPEYGHAPGIETTTGPLGQGIATSVGFALGERILNARFGNDLVDHYTYVVAGDGCLMEGISQEAITLAGHLKLSKLIVLFDDNGISIDGPVDLTTSEDQLARFKAAGWDVQAIDGHDPKAIEAAIAKARASDTPSLIACKTIIGYGAPKKQGSAATHGSPLGAEEIAGARAKLGWDFPPFEIPEDVLSAWRAVGKRGETARLAWQERVDDLGSDIQEELDRVLAGTLPAGFDQAVEAFKKAVVEEKPKIATRMSSQRVIDALAPVLPELIGGSADLTGSNNTKAKEAAIVKAGDYRGSYIHYGIREHGMAAAMNGLALHGGVIPFGGTFMVFTDYCRPAIRLSALMGLRVIYIMTHDSIGLGEDGPTHQPVEHLAALRAIPNLNVFRPADTVETAEAWQIALQSTGTPSIISLTRQALPTLRTTHASENLTAKGGYVLAEAEGKRQVTLIGTGSEVSLAMEARDKLKAEGIGAAVVSLPCWELFDAQPESYRAQVLGDCPRIAVEAALGFGWERYTGAGGCFVGMTGFGASAPAPALYKHFGITADAVAAAAKARI
ncbi:transketolase [Oceanibaculum pacificum]|uniref:Transketolase n=1 Tax=Oceanibaculum pacificum TaxID=580166 RepID=A0A154VQJ4_9PROT|nr:transketolase [Oceanibaculum pacificum]KZD03535.1 transketolase [Oceanibaculum pacificum]